MNKLSTCELFTMVDSSFKGGLLNIIKEAAESIDKYSVDYVIYDYMIKSMRTYKYPLSKHIVKAASKGEIRPLILADPKDGKDKQLFLPSAIATFSSSDLKTGYVDISPRGGYNRDKLGRVETLKIKEIDFYAYLNMAFLDLYLKKYSAIIDKSTTINKNIAIAYSRLFSRCIDRTYPISANPEKFEVSIFLSAVFSLVNFFGYTIEDAKNLVFSSGISKKSEIESDCKVLTQEKLQFTNLTEFLQVYGYEFSDYIKDGSLNIRMMVNLFQKMYGANSWFALEHSITFFNMILSVPIGLYNDKYISKTIKAQVDNVNVSLASIFSS